MDSLDKIKAADFGQKVRSFFPIYQRKLNGRDLVYFDSAASSLKPSPVIDRIVQYYERQCVNVHRGLYKLSEEVSADYEKVRDDVAGLINCSNKQVAFTSGTTDSLNIIARGMDHLLDAGDEIIVSTMEHHANIVPWQMLGERKQTVIRVIPLLESGDLDVEALLELAKATQAKVLSLVWVSNALGVVNDIQSIIAEVRKINPQIVIVVDAAQAVSTQKVNVQAVDCDFLVFSAHKLFGPTGVGVLYGKTAALSCLKPLRGGGDMIRSVAFSGTTFADPPHIFEAGTPNIAGVLGLGAAIRFFRCMSIEDVSTYEDKLVAYALEMLKRVDGLKVVGVPKRRGPIISFILDKVHPHDLATILDQYNIAMRAGFHCAQPLHEALDLTATTRISFSIYNDRADIDQLIVALNKAVEILQ